VDAAQIISLIAAERVTHYCGAPIVHAMIRDTAVHQGVRFDPPVCALIGGAPIVHAMIHGSELGLTVINGLQVS
jgi:fatty-acyl-CoA synthase